MQSDNHYFYVIARCPTCPGNPVRGVGVGKEDIENEARLRVFSIICGHDWYMPDDTAAKMKRAKLFG